MTLAPVRAAPPIDLREALPHDTRAEASVLGACLLAGDASTLLRAAAAGVDTSVFHRPSHAELWRTLTAMMDDDQPIDAVTVADSLNRRGWPAGLDAVYLHTLIEQTPSAANVGHYAAIVVDRALDRLAVEAERRFGQALTTGDRDAAMTRLRADLDEIDKRRADAGPNAGQKDQRLVDGERFLFADDAETPAIWGKPGGPSLWADGESLMLAGPPGIGKSTIAHLLVFGRLGLIPEVLGHPVVDDGGAVLYLAMDRPRQLRRAMRRLARPDAALRAVLRDRLVVHQGPLPVDITRPDHARFLLDLAHDRGATTLVVDSVKDLLPNASDESAAGGYNVARQHCLAGGVEVIESHHNRKANGDNRAPRRLDDIYGSRYLTAGAGSVLSLWGESGDVVVELTQLKAPGQEILPMKIQLDTEAGTVRPYEQVDLPALLARAGTQGVTAAGAAAALFSTAKPTDSQRENVRTRLNRLVRDGRAEKCWGGADGLTGYRLPTPDDAS